MLQNRSVDQVLIPIESRDAADSRAAPRRKIFIPAILMIGTNRQAGCIRNLSRSGATIETQPLPKVKSSIRLVRGSLQVDAEVIWLCGDRCGVRFEEPIDLSQWLPSPAASGQVGVDYRIGAVRGALATPAQRPPDEELLVRRISEEVGLAGRKIALALDKLSDYKPLTVRHPKPLQELEVLSQLLSHLQRLMEADDPISILDGIGMEELKCRLLRRP